MNTGWNFDDLHRYHRPIINLLGNEYWLERMVWRYCISLYYKPTGK